MGRPFLILFHFQPRNEPICLPFSNGRTRASVFPQKRERKKKNKDSKIGNSHFAHISAGPSLSSRFYCLLLFPKWKEKREKREKLPPFFCPNSGNWLTSLAHFFFLPPQKKYVSVKPVAIRAPPSSTYLRILVGDFFLVFLVFLVFSFDFFLFSKWDTGDGWRMRLGGLWSALLKNPGKCRFLIRILRETKSNTTASFPPEKKILFLFDPWQTDFPPGFLLFCPRQ